MSTGLSVCPVGSGIALTTTTTVSVANVACATNTFRFVNANASVYSYVGVFNNYADAAAAHHPVAGTPGNLLVVAPNDSVNVVGNFGINPNPGTVYIAAITATGSTTTFATPIAP
jgi:hypothetical protein